MGVIDKEGNFIALFTSNTVTTPSDVINQDGDEVWMSKMSDWVEIIEASLERLSVGDPGRVSSKRWRRSAAKAKCAWTSTSTPSAQTSAPTNSSDPPKCSAAARFFSSFQIHGSNQI